MYKHTFYYFLGNKKYPEIYILHLKISKIYPKKSNICSFLRSIWKNLHLTEFFRRTNIRYGHCWAWEMLKSTSIKQRKSVFNHLFVASGAWEASGQRLHLEHPLL